MLRFLSLKHSIPPDEIYSKCCKCLMGATTKMNNMRCDFGSVWKNCSAIWRFWIFHHKNLWVGREFSTCLVWQCDVPFVRWEWVFNSWWRNYNFVMINLEFLMLIKGDLQFFDHMFLFQNDFGHMFLFQMIWRGTTFSQDREPLLWCRAAVPHFQFRFSHPWCWRQC